MFIRQDVQTELNISEPNDLGLLAVWLGCLRSQLRYHWTCNLPLESQQSDLALKLMTLDFSYL